MKAPKLELVQLCKSFDSSVAATAVDRVDLEVMAGETLALLGPSGCGKSTTLNMVVGLELPTSGDIRIDGRSVLNVPAGSRNVGLVFQDYAVFTHMTVRQNLAFGLAVRGVTKREQRRVVAETAELLGLATALDTPARELGGSELQRVAIGRTLATRPDVLLLDEPLSNLEAAARLAMRKELRRLQAEIGLTIIYVTHDQIEALSLADRIAVMSEGRIRQVADTSTIYNLPDHLFVASFLGSPPMNLLPGRIGRRGDSLVLEQGEGCIYLGASGAVANSNHLGSEVVLGVRAESLLLTASPDATWSGLVTAVELRGPEAIVSIQAPQGALKVVVASRMLPGEGERVGVRFPPRDCVIFDNTSGKRLAATATVARVA